MRRITALSTLAAGLLGLAVYINPAIGIPHPPPDGTPPPIPTPTSVREKLCTRGLAPDIRTTPIGEVVTLSGHLSNTHVLQGSDGQLFLELTVTGQERETTLAPNRLPMNLGIVIDRSGSMGSQNKIAYARQAAEFLVDQLLPTDRVSLVAYDHQVQVLLNSQLVGDGSEVKATIRRLTPGGNTNLHGGMVAGAKLVKQHVANQQVNRVILISDGLANVGVTDTPALTQIAQLFSNDGVSVTAMGVGVDFNEDLMLGLAEFSGGNYYYIDEPGKLASIFTKELTQLVATVAQNANVSIRLGKGVTCIDVPGYTFQQAGDTLTIPLGDIPAGRTRNILVRLRVPTDAPGDHAVARAGLSYSDGEDGRTRDFTSRYLMVHRTENSAVVVENRNSAVLEQNERVGAASVVERAIVLYEEGKGEVAQSLLRSESEALQERNDADYRSDRLSAQAKEMDDLAESLASAPVAASAPGKDIRKRAKVRSYDYKK